MTKQDNAVIIPDAQPNTIKTGTPPSPRMFLGFQFAEFLRAAGKFWSCPYMTTASVSGCDANVIGSEMDSVFQKRLLFVSKLQNRVMSLEKNASYGEAVLHAGAYYLTKVRVTTESFPSEIGTALVNLNSESYFRTCAFTEFVGIYAPLLSEHVSEALF